MFYTFLDSKNYEEFELLVYCMRAIPNPLLSKLTISQTPILQAFMEILAWKLGPFTIDSTIFSL